MISRGSAVAVSSPRAMPRRTISSDAESRRTQNSRLASATSGSAPTMAVPRISAAPDGVSAKRIRSARKASRSARAEPLSAIGISVSMRESSASSSSLGRVFQRR
ncbi:Uncharacterised protein [Mycobacteroides abscessus subsp. abscessus]|nr:Uncharacterised protein [Mycobacteroides abscessus subsp. abscessus]